MTHFREFSSLDVVFRRTLHGLRFVSPSQGSCSVDAAEVSVISDGRDYAQLQIEYDFNGLLDELTTCLAVLCHGRHDLRVNEEPLLDWMITKGLVEEAELGQDVLQFVHVDANHLARFHDGARMTSDATRILWRDKDHLPVPSPEAFAAPKILNTEGVCLWVHGRGVHLTCGQPLDIRCAAQATSQQLLLAVERLRPIRKRLNDAFRNYQDHPRPTWDGRIDQVKAMRTLTRETRIQLAVDVCPMVNGMFSPDLMLDEVRGTVSKTLNLDRLYQDSLALVVTMDDVAESLAAEALQASIESTESRERNWRLLIGTASGLALPLALILAYFPLAQRKMYRKTRH